MRARRSSIINSVSNRMRSDNKNRNQINHKRIRAFVDGIGGLSEYQNHLEEKFQCEFDLESMGRQARAIPQNWEARCPGSLRTNWVNPHPRAGVTQPTSADLTICEIGSWLDHPGSYYVKRMRTPTEWTGPGARRNLEATSGCARFLKNRLVTLTTAGSILAQVLIFGIERFFMVAERG